MPRFQPRSATHMCRRSICWQLSVLATRTITSESAHMEHAGLFQPRFVTLNARLNLANSRINSLADPRPQAD